MAMATDPQTNPEDEEIKTFMKPMNTQQRRHKFRAEGSKRFAMAMATDPQTNPENGEI